MHFATDDEPAIRFPESFQCRLSIGKSRLTPRSYCLSASKLNQQTTIAALRDVRLSSKGLDKLNAGANGFVRKTGTLYENSAGSLPSRTLRTCFSFRFSRLVIFVRSIIRRQIDVILIKQCDRQLWRNLIILERV